MCLGVGECWESGGVVRSPGGSKCPHRFRGLEEAGSATSQDSWPPLTCILKVCSSQPGVAGISRRQPGPSSDQLATERHPLEHGGFPGGSAVGNPSAIQETQVRSLGREDPLEEGTATHSSILAWRNPWTEEPGGPQSGGSQRVRHD